ncbi:MAG: aspartate/glutamate racemase family protein [Acidobacteria bacterium]|nr:aspartate/glutamate racemase family protein [Acidobacteriota bacterium]
MNGRLGIIDWGIGGISVYKLIKQQRPDVSVVYFSDTGATPYGKMSRAELIARLNTVIGFLKDKGVSHLVIGCNAASTAIPYLDPLGLKIEGVIDAAAAMTSNLKPKCLGLIGGRRTVLSGVYREAFAGRGIKVEQRIAQPLSALIESGDTSSDKLRGQCKRILTPIRNCSHILMACTHYPAIENVMKEFVSPETIFIDPAAELAKRTKSWALDEKKPDAVYTSGDAEQMASSASNAFGFDLKNITVEKLKSAVRPV